MRVLLSRSVVLAIVSLLAARVGAQDAPPSGVPQEPPPSGAPQEPPPQPPQQPETGAPPSAPPAPAEPAPPAPQEAEAAAQAEAPVEQPVAVGEDIIVTAAKRETKLLDEPISVSVVSSESLKEAGSKNLTELQSVTPGIYFSGNAGYGGAPMAIRGTSGSNTALLDDPVAVYVDGIYLVSGTFASTTLLDIASIEVARGPQGTLQGRNATAGAVIIRTADPKWTFGGYARGSIAYPLEYRLEAAVTAPVVDTLAVRAAAGYVKERGWAKNTFDDTRLASNESILGRLTFLWTPADPIRIRLSSTYSVVEAEPALARWAQTPATIMDPPTPTTPLPQAEIDAIEDGNFSLNRRGDSNTKTSLNALEATYSFENFADLISVTGFVYSKIHGFSDSDGMGRTDREGFNNGDTETTSFSEELRLQSNTDGVLSWIVGGYYSISPQDFSFRINNLQLTVPIRRYQDFIADQESASYAGFADGTLRFLEDFTVTLGGRYTYESRDFVFDTSVHDFDTGMLLMDPPPTYRPETKGWNDFSYRAKLTYTPLDEVLLYASLARGFKSGGFNAFGSNPAFDPEYLLSSELGVKAELPDKRGFVAASGYINNYDDLQVRVGVMGGGVAILNAADSLIRGFEVEGQVVVGGGVSLQGNVAYTHARFDNFDNAVDLFGMPVNAAGNRLPRTPEWQFFAQANYDRDLGTEWAMRLQASYRWRDRVWYYQTNQDAENLQGEPLGELGARATVFYDPAGLSLSVFGTNLINDRSVNGFNPNFNYPVVAFNKPRVVGVEVEAQF